MRRGMKVLEESNEFLQETNRELVKLTGLMVTGQKRAPDELELERLREVELVKRATLWKSAKRAKVVHSLRSWTHIAIASVIKSSEIHARSRSERLRASVPPRLDVLGAGHSRCPGAPPPTCPPAPPSKLLRRAPPPPPPAPPMRYSWSERPESPEMGSTDESR